MKLDDWNDFYDDNGIELSQPEQKKSSKSCKRKWREIEMIKEKQRLRRELSEFYHEMP